MPLIALWLARHVLLLADPQQLANGRAQFRFLFWTSTLPALAGIPLIIVFRVPRSLVEVAAVPAVVTIVGVSWMQAGAWLQAPGARAVARHVSVVYPLAAVSLLLLVFHLVLKRASRSSFLSMQRERYARSQASRTLRARHKEAVAEPSAGSPELQTGVTAS